MQTTKTITKRIWGVLLALCMLLSLMPMAAFAAEDPGVVYDYRFVTEDTIEIMGYNGTETDLVIPCKSTATPWWGLAILIFHPTTTTRWKPSLYQTP